MEDAILLETDAVLTSSCRVVVREKASYLSSAAVSCTESAKAPGRLTVHIVEQPTRDGMDRVLTTCDRNPLVSQLVSLLVLLRVRHRARGGRRCESRSR